MTVEDEIGMIRQVINAITGVLTLFGAIALLAASFGIINTLYMSVQDRTREIGLMKAMGMGRFKVFLTFSIEALLIGFWGGVTGIAGAVVAGHFLNDFATTSFPTISQEKRRRASIYFYPHQIALTLLFFKGGKIVV